MAQQHPLDAITMRGDPDKGHAIAWFQHGGEGVETFGYLDSGFKSVGEVNKRMLAIVNSIITLELLPGISTVSAQTFKDGSLAMDIDYLGGVVRLQTRHVLAVGSYKEIARSLNNG